MSWSPALGRTNRRIMSLDEVATEDLVMKLSPVARRYLDTMLAHDFSAFVMKVFETVSPGDEFLPNWHIDAMTFAAEGMIDGRIKRVKKKKTHPTTTPNKIIFS